MYPGGDCPGQRAGQEGAGHRDRGRISQAGNHGRELRQASPRIHQV